MNILITGATGFIGQELIRDFVDKGHFVTALVRNTDMAISKFNHKNIDYISWPSIHAEFKIPKKHYHGLINLMGAGIADKRWSPQRKIELRNSRVLGTENLLEALSTQNITVDCLIQGSAIGIYGRDYLAQLCADWENAAFKFKNRFKRVCIVRTGMVLGASGGAFVKLYPVFKYGLGGKLGSGKQFMPWIHIEDMVGVINHCLHNEEVEGALNAVSNELVSNLEFTKVFGKVLGRPTFCSVPGFVLKLGLGELSSMLLTGPNVTPESLLSSGFSFKFALLENALKDVVQK